MNAPAIMGEQQLTADQLVRWYRSTNRPDPAEAINGPGPPLERLVGYYLEIGEKEGVRGDIAFIQAVLETGGFTNPDSDRHNFAGIGHPDGAAGGFPYPSVKAGVQAQIQLLKKVARGDEVRLETKPEYAPNWGGKHVERWDGLSGNWAEDTNYWSKISAIYRDAKDYARKHPGRGGDTETGQRGDGARGRDRSRRGAGSGSRPGHRAGAGDLRPWRIPRKGRTVKVSPERLRMLAESFTDHLAVVESVFNRCTHALNEIGRVQVAGDQMENRLRTALDQAIEDWEGLRRLPYLLSKDVGYLVEIRRRVEIADADDRRRKGYFAGDLSRADVLANRRTVEGLVATLGSRHSRAAARNTNLLLAQLFRKDQRSRALHRHLPRGPHRDRSRDSGRVPGRAPDRRGGEPSLSRVSLDRRYAGTQAIFEDFVIPFVLRRPGFDRGDIVSTKRERKHTADGNVSDHYIGNTRAYAADFATTRGEDDARALAKAFGIDNWAPGSRSYTRHPIEIDGRKFSVQILWAVPGHFDHIHVGIRRV